MSGDKLDQVPEFHAAVVARLERGRIDYGETSFSMPTDRLCHEIEQELLDVDGWSYMLWTRIREVRARLAGLVAEENRLLARIQYLRGQEREAEGTRNHPGPNTIGGCEMTAAE